MYGFNCSGSTGKKELNPCLWVADIGVRRQRMGGQTDGLAVVLQGLCQTVLLVDLVAKVSKLLRFLSVLMA
jgi:hypothetical protein